MCVENLDAGLWPDFEHDLDRLTSSTRNLRGLGDAQREAVNVALRAYQAQLDSLHSFADPVKQEGHVLAKIRLCHSILSPVWLLPPEIVGYIFQLYLSEPSEYPHLRIIAKSRRPQQVDGSSSRTTLSLVCTAWKDVVDNHPRLWTDVTMQLRSGSTFSPSTLSKDDVVGFRRSLNNIAGCPWTLHLDFRQLPDFLCHSAYGQPTSTPLSHVLTTQSLISLRFLHTCGEERRTGLGSLTIPSVESLLMERDFTMPIPPPPKDGQLDLPQLPGLRKVAFVEVDLATLPPHLSWDRLTHIYLESATTVERMLLIFRSCPELQEVSFQGELISPPTAHSNLRLQPPEHIRLDQLTKIQFRHAPLTLNLSTISWPNLTHMQIQTTPPVPLWHDKNHSLFHSITHLHLSRGWDFECTKYLIPMLDSWCPLLSHLVLNPNIPADYTQLFRDLTLTKEARRLPHLQVLGLNMEDTLLEPYGWATGGGASSLLSTVESRCDETKTSSRLRRLVLRINSSQWDAARDEAIFESLRRFKESLEVVVVGKVRCRYQDVTFDGNFTEWECEGLRELTGSLSHFRYSFTYQNP